MRMKCMHFVITIIIYFRKSLRNKAQHILAR